MPSISSALINEMVLWEDENTRTPSNTFLKFQHNSDHKQTCTAKFGKLSFSWAGKFIAEKRARTTEALLPPRRRRLPIHPSDASATIAIAPPWVALKQSTVPMTVTPTNCWLHQISSLRRLCHVGSWEELPAIWHHLTPLEKDKVRWGIEAAVLPVMFHLVTTPRSCSTQWGCSLLLYALLQGLQTVWRTQFTHPWLTVTTMQHWIRNGIPPLWLKWYLIFRPLKAAVTALNHAHTFLGKRSYISETQGGLLPHLTQQCVPNGAGSWRIHRGVKSASGKNAPESWSGLMSTFHYPAVPTAKFNKSFRMALLVSITVQCPTPSESKAEAHNRKFWSG